MHVTSFNISLGSTQPEQLLSFYRDIVGFPQEEDSGALRITDGGRMYFDGHSDITGPTREPARVLINFFVENLAAEQARLEAAGVRFIRSAGREFWGGIISTFVDPDGNYAQLIEFRPEEATTEQ